MRASGVGAQNGSLALMGFRVLRLEAALVLEQPLVVAKARPPAPLTTQGGDAGMPSRRQR